MKGKIRFGVVGAGLWGEAHAEVYATHPHAELAAVCDMDPERARRTADRYGARRTYTNYEELVADPWSRRTRQGSTSTGKNLSQPAAKTRRPSLRPCGPPG